MNAFYRSADSNKFRWKDRKTFNMRMTERFGTPDSSNWCLHDTPILETVNNLKNLEKHLEEFDDIDTVNQWISSLESYIAERYNQPQTYNDEDLTETLVIFTYMYI